MGSVHTLDAGGWPRAALDTANDRFKARYSRHLATALVISLVVWVQVFLFTPELDIEPYRLREDVTEVVVVQPEAIAPPEEPREVRRPVELDVVPDKEIDVEVDIAPSTWDEAPVFSPPGETGAVARGFDAFDTKPALVRFVRPDYPEFAREAGFAGVVYVDVLVGTDGRVRQTRLQRGVHALLDRAALEAARQARFTPGKQRDLPVEVWVTLPYGFVLD